MKSNSEKPSVEQAGRISPVTAILLGLGCLAIVAMLVIRQRASYPRPEPSAATSSETAAATEASASAPTGDNNVATAPVSPLPGPGSDAEKPAPPVIRPAAGTNAASAKARSVASAETRQMVDALTRMNPGGMPLTGEQAAAWKQNLQALIQQGAGAIPAIRDFLELNKDFMFGPENAQMLGYESARGALFETLRQIGGPEGTQATLEALRRTGDPREILALARNLDSMAPGEYRQEMLDSTRQVLSMAAQGDLQGYDVGPLFEVLQKYGGSAALPDLEQGIARWKYYGAIGLVNLPDGAGIPSLIQMAGGTGGNREIALQMLAQVSTQYPEARAALMDQVASGKIPANLWPYLGSVLGGDHYQLPDALWSAAQKGEAIERQKTGHVGFGNQNFYQGPLPGGVPPEQLREQIALVDEISGATSDPAAKQALQNAKVTLNERLARITAPPPAANP